MGCAMVVDVSPWIVATTLGCVRSIPDRVQRDHLAPRCVNRLDPRSDPLQNFCQQQTETAEIDDQNRITWRGEACQRSLDTCPRGPVHEERPAVPGPEDRAIERHDFVHIGGHFGIELAEKVGGHRPQNARMGIDGTRPHQQALGRVDLTEVGVRHEGPPHF